MRKFLFWQRWLLVFSIIVVMFGLFMAVCNRTHAFDLMNRQINSVFWQAPASGDAALPEGLSDFQGWIYSVLGATMSGWGVMLVFVVAYPFRSSQCWARNAVALALGVWFAFDSLFSLLAGVLFNAVVNAVFLLLAAIPLAATWREFH